MAPGSAAPRNRANLVREWDAAVAAAIGVIAATLAPAGLHPIAGDTLP